MKKLCHVLMVVLVALPSLARAEAVAETQAERPKVAVVLAGGGAKGAAHIGVLKAVSYTHLTLPTNREV